MHKWDNHNVLFFHWSSKYINFKSNDIHLYKVKHDEEINDMRSMKYTDFETINLRVEYLASYCISIQSLYSDMY